MDSAAVWRLRSHERAPEREFGEFGSKVPTTRAKEIWEGRAWDGRTESKWQLMGQVGVKIEAHSTRFCLYKPWIVRAFWVTNFLFRIPPFLYALPFWSFDQTLFSLDSLASTSLLLFYSLPPLDFLVRHANTDAPQTRRDVCFSAYGSWVGLKKTVPI